MRTALIYDAVEQLNASFLDNIQSTRALTSVLSFAVIHECYGGQMTNQSVPTDKYDITVDIDGSNPPSAILTFEETTLCESLRKAKPLRRNTAFQSSPRAETSRPASGHINSDPMMYSRRRC